MAVLVRQCAMGTRWKLVTGRVCVGGREGKGKHRGRRDNSVFSRTSGLLFQTYLSVYPLPQFALVYTTW